MIAVFSQEASADDPSHGTKFTITLKKPVGKNILQDEPGDYDKVA